jgi:hypothetical protein
MAHVKNIRTFSFLLLFFITTSCSNKSIYQQAVVEFQENLDTFYNVNGLLNHFPKMQSKKASGFVCPPAIIAKSGEVLHCDLNNRKETNTLIQNLSFIDSVQYHSNSIFILRVIELKNKSLYNQLYHFDNATINNGLPVPLFADINFGLGDTVDYIDSAQYQTMYKSIVPKDLMVYIIDAKVGDFWKNQNTETRPETLGKWKHGYSRGIAISKEKELICYWAMVW